MDKQIIAAQIDGSANPCPNMAKIVGNCVEDSINHVLETSEPTILPTVDGNMVLMKEQAYLYFLSKCTEDELWDLGFLGCSEKHARPVNVPIFRKPAG